MGKQLSTALSELHKDHRVFAFKLLRRWLVSAIERNTDGDGDASKLEAAHLARTMWQIAREPVVGVFLFFLPIVAFLDDEEWAYLQFVSSVIYSEVKHFLTSKIIQ